MTTLLYWPIFRPKIGTEGVSQCCTWINMQVFHSMYTWLTWQSHLLIILQAASAEILFALHPPVMNTSAQNETVGDTPTASVVAASGNGDIESCVDNPMNSGINFSVKNSCQSGTVLRSVIAVTLVHVYRLSSTLNYSTPCLVLQLLLQIPIWEETRHTLLAIHLWLFHLMILDVSIRFLLLLVTIVMSKF